MLGSSESSGAPVVSLVVPDDGDELLRVGVLPSLAAAYQREVGAGAYEVIVVARPERAALIQPLLSELGVRAELAYSVDPERDFIAGARCALGTDLAWLGAPGVASVLLVATLLAARATYPEAILIVPTFELEATASGSCKDWLGARGWPEYGDTLAVQATLGLSAEPRYRWLDPICRPQNVVLPASLIRDQLRSEAAFDPSSLAARPEVTRVQIVGDALVRPAPWSSAPRPPTPSAGGPVQSSLEYFGRVRFAPQQSVERPPTFRRAANARTTISSILVTYDMRRETPRTLQSLLPGYQQGVDANDYELIVVDNGSPKPLSDDEVRVIAPGARYYRLENPPPSPAYALNYGAARATGDIVAILSDGASLLSPAVFAQALAAFRAFPRPVVITQYFYLGPGRQTQTVMMGYDRNEEDRLLAGVSWPDDGYRLFEIASPETLGGPEGSWLGGWFESDCIIMSRDTFETLDGCDERFDLPGGGLMIMDLLFRTFGLPDVQPVKLIGEGVFHQVHGGITTNNTPEMLQAEERRYTEQYQALRGPVPVGLPKSFYFLGSLKTPAARAKMKD